ncbi:MAG TPA: TadE/TadG family type IV pilus assembly protein [Acidimicrobiales bacterium]|jgi:Flp pilus assembly protein TadG|nr:TadE/TadG family type IV pilus assembly protein [Acidimicrobiales bacterium]
MKHSDRGDATVEMVLLTPLLILVLTFVVLAGRISSTDADVASAAADAARAASQRQTPAAGAADARTAAVSTLADKHVSCHGGPAVTVDTARFGHGGDVTVTLACTVSLADLAVAGIPGSRTVRASASVPIDTRRSGP